MLSGLLKQLLICTRLFCQSDRKGKAIRHTVSMIMGAALSADKVAMISPPGILTKG
ncbi:hypothetical protein PTE_00165 [Photorhabdus khanii NC19]|uniref:Uncharacterized protein n=1 Tax=Photorhabdus khanii NC19 TaxID=1004151 RepID=W3VB38_9GAMM|nr:hypothetical protein PTE_00165 [Photorhabdus khanii NC19]